MNCEIKGCSQRAQWICSVHNWKFCDTHHRVHYKECKHHPRLIEDIELRLLPLVYKLNDYKSSVINFSNTLISKIMNFTDDLIQLAISFEEQTMQKLIEDFDYDIKPFFSKFDLNKTEIFIDHFESFIKNLFENNLIKEANQIAAFTEISVQTHENFTQTDYIDSLNQIERLKHTLNIIDGVNTDEINIESVSPIPLSSIVKSRENFLPIAEVYEDQKINAVDVHPQHLIFVEENGEVLIPVNQRLASMSLQEKKLWVMEQALDLSICKDIQDIQITKDNHFLLICNNKAVGISNKGIYYKEGKGYEDLRSSICKVVCEI